jgi:hypothetical protein
MTFRLTSFSLFVHQRDRHDDIVRDREANLKVGAERDLHSKEDIGEDRHQLCISPSLCKTRSQYKPRKHMSGPHRHQVQNNLFQIIKH